jgi:pimeloyl-ACP methyl ester carboxylesterase
MVLYMAAILVIAGTLLVQQFDHVIRCMIYLNWALHPNILKTLRDLRVYFHSHPARTVSAMSGKGEHSTIYGWHLVPSGQEARDVASALSAGRGDDAFDASLARATRVVLFFHGIAGCRGGVWAISTSARVALVRALATQFGDSTHVVTFDYRGFGDCPGQPSEAGIVCDAHAAWAWVSSRVDPSKCSVVVYGQSLGSAVAARLVDELLISAAQARAKKHAVAAAAAAAAAGVHQQEQASTSPSLLYDKEKEDQRQSERPLGNTPLTQPLLLPAGLVLDAPFTCLADAALYHPTSRALLGLLSHFPAPPFTQQQQQQQPTPSSEVPTQHKGDSSGKHQQQPPHLVSGRNNNLATWVLEWLPDKWRTENHVRSIVRCGASLATTDERQEASRGAAAGSRGTNGSGGSGGSGHGGGGSGGSSGGHLRRRRRLPILVVAHEKDEVVPVELSRRVLQAAVATTKAAVEEEDEDLARHRSSEEPSGHGREEATSQSLTPHLPLSTSRAWRLGEPAGLFVKSPQKVMKRYHVDAFSTYEWVAALGLFLDGCAS